MTLKIVFSIILCFVIVSGCISGEDTTKSNLQFTSSPSGAEVYINSQYRGSTPCTLSDIETGNYTLEMRYPGYQTWTAGIIVSSGTSNFYAALKPLAGQQPQNTTQQISTPSVVTVRAGRDTMIIGNSNLFSGTCTGCDSVELVLYGPGKYEQGVLLDRPKTNAVGSWSYTWNPGYSIQSGHYTMVVNNADKTTSDSVEFLVVGGGVVTIASSTYSADKGETLKFSGQCTTGAHNVVLILYGPERFSSGIELGTISVTADNTWSFKYTLDTSIPTGVYTMNVYDVPTTASSTTQFTVGFV